MLYSDYLDLDSRDLPRHATHGQQTSAQAPVSGPWARIATTSGAGDAGKDCPVANDVLDADLSTDPAFAGRSWSRAWTDLGSVLGNFLGGGLFIGGLFLIPFALRQLLALL